MNEIKENKENFWELYGLKTNPFSTSPLLVQGGLLPLESFCGRKEELARITKLFGIEGGSRILVCGDIGVGKTSFVNVARFHALTKGHFTPFKEIAVQSGWDSNLFIINTLYAIYSSLRLQKDTPLGKELFDKLKSVVEISSMETRLGGISIAGFGADISRSRTQGSSISNMALIDFFQEIIKEIKENTKKDVIIHYNNLERLSEKNLRELFEDLRDFFQTENTHFVFVGNLTVHSIFQSMPRVSSIMSDTPIILDELSIEEIEKIIRIRLSKLRISNELNYIIPFKPEVLKTLFELYRGNIRNILNSLSTAVSEVTHEKPVVLDHNLLAQTLKSVVETRYFSKLPPRAKDVVLEAVKHFEITNRALSANTKIARSNVSMYLSDLEISGCVYLRRKDGKDKYWSVEPKIKWYLLNPISKKQKDLGDFTVEK